MPASEFNLISVNDSFFFCLFVCCLGVGGRESACICSTGGNRAPHPGSGSLMLYPLRETNPHNSVKGRRRRGVRQIKRESFPVTGSANSGDRRGRYTGSASGLLAYFANITLNSSKRLRTTYSSSLCCSVRVFTTSDFTNDSSLQCPTFFCYLTSLYS